MSVTGTAGAVAGTGAVSYVGIDLAWGDRAPTGVAVLDGAARLLHVSAVRTDEEIVAAVSAYTEGACLVAIDAPLVVVNATGSRPAEQALSKDFRCFEAGTHPSNTGKPEFANGTRGARVAAALGVPIDASPDVRRRAVEVYPHPATVVLFGLDKTLKYKNKTGRDLELLRSELLRLMTLLESVVTTDADPAWATLRADVEQASRKSELRRVEDQVDAVVCAYVALFADRSPDQVSIYGDDETGFILTPSLAALPSGERAAVLRRALGRYAADHAELTLAGAEAVALVTALLDEAGINYLSVTGRTKTVASFAEKAGRTRDGVVLYRDPLTEITDQLGVRVIAYVVSDVDAVADLLADQVVVKDDRDMGQETASEGRFGYASRHLLITLDPVRESAPGFAHLAGRVAQVQVRTVLQHAWAEFEHDIRYKGAVPAEHVREFDRRFTLAAGLLELADQEFSTIRSRLRGTAPSVGVGDGAPGSAPGSRLGNGLGDDPHDDPRIDPRELAAFLAGQYSDAEWSRADHYGWISGLLLELGVTSLGELGGVLRATDPAAIAASMEYRYPPGAVRRLDDALLSTYGRRYVDLHGNAHRTDALVARWEKLTG